MLVFPGLVALTMLLLAACSSIHAVDFVLRADGGSFRIEDVLALNSELAEPLLGAVRYHLGDRFLEAVRGMMVRLATKTDEVHQELRASMILAMVVAEIGTSLSQDVQEGLTEYDTINHEWLPF